MYKRSVDPITVAAGNSIRQFLKMFIKCRTLICLCCILIILYLCGIPQAQCKVWTMPFPPFFIYRVLRLLLFGAGGCILYTETINQPEETSSSPHVGRHPSCCLIPASPSGTAVLYLTLSSDLPVDMIETSHTQGSMKHSIIIEFLLCRFVVRSVVFLSPWNLVCDSVIIYYPQKLSPW